MESKFQRWWLYSCFAAVVVAAWAGGFSMIITAVFIVIYLTGVALIGPDEAENAGDAAPDREDEESEDAAV